MPSIPVISVIFNNPQKPQICLRILEMPRLCLHRRQFLLHIPPSTNHLLNLDLIHIISIAIITQLILKTNWITLRFICLKVPWKWKLHIIRLTITQYRWAQLKQLLILQEVQVFRPLTISIITLDIQHLFRRLNDSCLQSDQ